MKQIKKFISNKYFAYFLGFVFLFLLWYIISLCIDENVMVFPNPFATFKETFVILSSSYIYKCMASSFLRILIGFLISLFLAMVFGIIAGNLPFIKRFLLPLITTLKSIPTATLVFFFLVLVGAKNAPILMVILISFPILYESVAKGIENIDEGIKNATSLDGSKNIDTIVKIQIPLLTPYLLVGISSSFALSFKIEIMAEILTGDTRLGLGAAILSAQRNDPTNMVPIFAYSLVVILFVLLISLLSKLINKALID